MKTQIQLNSHLMRCMKRVLSGFLALLLALGVSHKAVATSETPPNMGLIANRITVRVMMENPAYATDPSAPRYLPVDNLPVQRIPTFEWEGTLVNHTDSQGMAVFEFVQTGQTAVFLPDPTRLDPPESPPVYDTHIFDPQVTYLQMGYDNRDVTVDMVLRLKGPDAEKTGGIRLQKAYYPGFLTDKWIEMVPLRGGNYLIYPMEKTRLQFSGPNVAGARFVVRGPTGFYWHSVNGFVENIDDAERFVTDSNGQVLIEGLPLEPPYFENNPYQSFFELVEVDIPANMRSAYNGSSLSVNVLGGQVGMPSDYALNVPNQFLALLNKIDSETRLQLTGGEFVVYKEVNGQKQYLYYERGLSPGLPVYPAYTPDVASAHRFSAGYYHTAYEFTWMGFSYASDPNNIAIPGLDVGTTYYLQELEAPDGYQLPANPLVLTAANAYDLPMYEDPVTRLINTTTMENTRDPGTFHVVKVGGPEATWGSMVQRIGDARFVLMQSYHADPAQEVTATTPPEDMLYRFLLGGASRSGEAPVWSQPMTYAQLQQALAAATPEHPREEILMRLASDYALGTNPASGEVIYHLGTQAQNYIYTPLEVVAPAGYQLNTSSQSVFVAGGEAIPALVVENQPKTGTVFLRKTDWIGQVPLAGAEFILLKDNMYLVGYLPDGSPVYSANKEDAKKFVSDAYGRIVIEGLEFAKNYQLMETKAPEGYVAMQSSAGMWDYAFELNEQTSSVYRQYPNRRIQTEPIAIQTIKTQLGGALAGGDFTFELVLPSGDILATVTNDASGQIRFEQVRIPVLMDAATGLIKDRFELTLRERIDHNKPGVVYDLKEIKLPVIYGIPSDMRSDLQDIIPPMPIPRDSPYVSLGVWAILAMILGSLLLEVQLLEGFTNELALTEHTVSKEWRNTEGLTTLPPVTVQLLQNGEVYDEVTMNGIPDATDPDHPITATGSGELTPWVYTWKGLPALLQQPNEDPNDPSRVVETDYVYSSREVRVPMHFQHIRSEDIQGNHVMVNIYRPGTFTAHKAWQGAAGVPVKLQLYKLLLNNPTAPGIKVGDPVLVDGVVNENADGSGELIPWYYSWVGLPATEIRDGVQVSLKYSIEEVDLPDDFAVDTRSSSSVNLMNVAMTTQRTVTKYWSGGGESRPLIRFQLYQDDVPFGRMVTLNGTPDTDDPAFPITLNGSGELTAWTYTWKGLPRYSRWDPQDYSKRREYVYRVEEEALDGYKTVPGLDGWNVTNIFVPPTPVTVTPLAKKLLTGTALGAGDFTFTLSDSTGVRQTKTNDAAGNVVFEAIPFTQPGIYTYTLKEVPGTRPDIQYSTSVITLVYDVRVKMPENVLVAELVTGGDAAFTNLYAPTPTPTVIPPPVRTPTTEPEVTIVPVTATPTSAVIPTPTSTTTTRITPTRIPVRTDPPVVPEFPMISIPLTAKKTLGGGALKANEFYFELRDARGTVLATVGNAADGTITFPDRTFTREVTNYLYTIVEVAGADSGTTYDKAVYTVKVTTRAVNGQLVPTIEVEKDGILTSEGIVFSNHRKVPSTGDSMPVTIAMVLSAALALGFVALMLRRRKRS